MGDTTENNHQKRDTPAELAREEDKNDPWWSWPLGLVVAVVLIVWPQWTVPFALVWAVVWTWLDEPDIGEDPDDVSWNILGLAILYFGLEFLFWLAFASNEYPFTELLFPTKDTPLDFSLSFVGWILLFRAICGWLRARWI